jgi:hypothetical protein
MIKKIVGFNHLGIFLEFGAPNSRKMPRWWDLRPRFLI